MKTYAGGFIALISVLSSTSSHALDSATQGKAVFEQRCNVCHSAEPNDGGGAQGPSLANLMGRAAGTNRQFPYTSALRYAHLRWDAATLDKFLRAPAALVPGTAMVVAVEQPEDRARLIAYFESLPKTPEFQNDESIEVPDKSRSSADWAQDAPGRVHHISPLDLPAPLSTKSVRNITQVVQPPKGAQLALPKGFQVQVFSQSTQGPRKMLVARDGSILVTESIVGKVIVMTPSPDGAHVETLSTFADGLKQPFGLAFYPSADDPQWLYVAENDRVERFRYARGDRVARSPPEVVTNDIPGGVGHYTRDISFAPDHKHFWISVGSGSNDAETMPVKDSKAIHDWASSQPMGAAWDTESHRAAVLEFDTANPTQITVYATGIRNCVSLTQQPANDALWCTSNERDALGDDLVPDYSSRVNRAQFYGWPWFYIGNNQDPRHPHERDDLAGKIVVPDVLYQAHSAPLSLMFYAPNTGKSAFPSDYFGDAFATFHGSWNRSLRTGYKIVRVRMKNNVPTGEYEDFLTGFIVDNQSVWGRPVALAQLADGSILMSEDGNNTIYRITYERR